MISLTAGEFSLLPAMAERPKQVLSRDYLLDLINEDGDVFDRTIDVAISRLRNKIEANPRSPELIKTIRNGGYLFDVKTQKVSRSL